MNSEPISSTTAIKSYTKSSLSLPKYKCENSYLFFVGICLFKFALTQENLKVVKDTELNGVILTP